VVIPELAAGAAAGEVVRRAIAASVVRLIVHDPIVRLDSDPEGVHQARVATRRIRSDLRTFASLLDPAWSNALRDELALLGAILGAVRDKDVLLLRLQKRTSTISDSSAGGASRVLGTLESERDEAYAELLEALRSKRYLALLDRLVEAASTPALSLEADLLAANVLPGLVRRPWSSLAKRVKSLDETPADADLHDVRIRAKRARYAAEAVSPLFGKQAYAFAAAAAGLQEILGDLNDAVVAERWLRDWARTRRSIPSVFTAGELAGLELAAARECRSRWRKAWKKLASPKLRSWM
jgi:CHAD domain-containing protein